MKNRSRLAALTLFALFATVLTDLPRPTAQTFRPVARGRRGVVAGGHPLSVEAGMRMLQRGGNAVDAGVATILAASVIEFSHFSFGGEVPILIKMRGTGLASEQRREDRWSRSHRRHGHRARESHARVFRKSE